MTPPRLLVLETGGTISAVPTPQGLRPSGTGSGRELLEDPAGITFESILSRPSAGIGLDEMGQLHARIQQAADQQFAAVVVTHGTDTLAETAFVLNLLEPRPRVPIILTGAMRAPSQTGSDAAKNLRDAVAVARAPGSAGQVLVVFDAKIFAGWCIEKVSGISYDAFASPLHGPLGYVAEGDVHMGVKAVAPALRIPLDCSSVGHVATLVALPGDPGALLHRVDPDFDGAVIAGMGAGHVPPQMMPAVTALAAKMPVLVTTGWPGGVGLRRTYSGPGSEVELAEAGVIGGWSLGSRKAALAMGLCLGQTLEIARVRDLLANNLRGLT